MRLEIAGPIVAVVSAVFALLAWLYPRSVRKSRRPKFEGTLKTKEVREFVDFLTKHDGNVVEISAAALVEVWNPAAKVVATMESDDKRPDRYLLTVYNADKSDIFAGGTLVSILPEQKTGWTSVTWANDYHHLRGFYYVQWNPGMWQGFVSVSLLTVLPPDVAIAD